MVHHYLSGRSDFVKFCEVLYEMEDLLHSWGVLSYRFWETIVSVSLTIEGVVLNVEETDSEGGLLLPDH